jgi:hypothetical protein
VLQGSAQIVSDRIGKLLWFAADNSAVRSCTRCSSTERFLECAIAFLDLLEHFVEGLNGQLSALRGRRARWVIGSGDDLGRFRSQ